MNWDNKTNNRNSRRRTARRWGPSALVFPVLLIISSCVLLAGEPAASDAKRIRAGISTLPYLHGYKSPSTKNGVTIYDKAAAQLGLNFYVSGGWPPIVLTDMTGKILHSWKINFKKLVQGNPIFRRAHLFSNGDVLVVMEMMGLLKVNREGEVIWFYRGSCHHDFDIAENGDIYVLCQGKKEIKLPDLDIAGSILDDYITVLTPEGKMKEEISIFESLNRSNFRPVLKNIQIEKLKGDIFHTNTLGLIDGSNIKETAPFLQGHALISLRNFHYIAIVDLTEIEVTWMLSGMWTLQHQPECLDNGNILVFDNLGENGYSEVIEFNPLTQEIVWGYRGNNKNGFCSPSLGSQQRLPNGNTLITESRDGRVFEVTPDNELVWEFINPQRATDDSNLVAAVYEMLRLDPTKLDFLKEKK
jgi:hypothetical protein